MTDTSSLAATHLPANSHSVTVQPLPSPIVPSPVPNGNSNAVAQQSVHDDEDEPYTIKCICSFEDDDGHTVFCERCETWQHILCYYDGEDVPEVHNCADCEPRPLNSKLATELQRRRREEQSDGGDRKSKRSGSKSHRKKVAAKDNNSNNSTGTLPSGVAAIRRTAGPPTRGLPLARIKDSHRSSNSINSLTGPCSFSWFRQSKASNICVGYEPYQGLPHPEYPLYSQEFLHLYDHDQANGGYSQHLFDNLQLANDFSSWYKILPWPVLSKQVVTDTSVEYDGRHPTWRFLTVENDVHKDEIIGEVKGKVGHFRDYCVDPNNRWHEFHHPLPFVFFHPQLPIYIDSRKEGSQLRYVRRSCHPNVTMKTVITNNIEYHFCLVANQDITAKSEITTSWYLDPQMFPSNNGFVKQEGSNDGISDDWPISISKVLANFGGCACDSSRSCRLAKVDCRRPPKSADTASKQVNGRRKKSKAKNAISPVNTGLANNSRAASEAVKAQVDDDQGGSRSRSTSNRPRSRDLTPTAHSPSVSDPLASMSGELSAREKRKIAAAEKKFEQLEHEQQQPQKKKKRSSGTSVTGTSNTATTAIGASQTNAKPLRIDTTSARRSSNSPRKRSPASVTPGPKPQSSQKKASRSTPIVASPLRRPDYVDSEMQTEPDENDPDFVPPKPPRRSGFVPLTTRLLKRCHEDRVRLQQIGNRINASPVYSSDIATPSIPDSQHAILSSPLSRREDVDMKDTDTPMTPPKISQHTTTTTIPPSPGTSAALSSLNISSDTSPQKPPHPLPSTVAHNFPMPRKPPDRACRADLRVQLPPAPPPFTTPSSTPNSMMTTPTHPTTSTSTYKDKPNSSTPILPTQSPHSFPIKSSPTNATTTTPTAAQHPMPTITPPSSAITPSPVKKKLSLGDYMSRRGTLTATTPPIEKPQPPLFSAGQSQSPSTPLQQQGANSQGQCQNSMDKDTYKVMASVDGRGNLAGGSDSSSSDTTVAQDVVMQDAGANTSSAPSAGVAMLGLPSWPLAASPSTSVATESQGGSNGYNNNGVGPGSGESRDPRLQHHSR
ncbi:PHD finger and SET domain-containing protein [Blastomyces dermatitidis ER-3]|uniref:PHD finger and SET domain-containing protein n=1 Tax=Ajellomyces dermatitidis (strain ER-3 / ATCC MYA-2586) TaxID=559297 RepID=A0ABP2ESK3_AJEDR|nr:PHD finger and SET domain-containing protein [Blastomyces dermatitidis ER-3]EEQ85543.2 PHD finger and SET domain-containing protein [Blastomyces dermatitidis ER-3]